MNILKKLIIVTVIAKAIVPGAALWAMDSMGSDEESDSEQIEIFSLDERPILTPAEQKKLHQQLLTSLRACTPTKYIAQFLNEGVDVNWAAPNCGSTPLLMTTMSNTWDSDNPDQKRINCNNRNAELLIKHNANVNTPNKIGNTPLIEAARWGHTEIVKLLLNNGADINAVNHAGKTALTAALYSSQWYTKSEIVKTLLEKITDEKTTQAVLHQIYPWMVISEQKSNDNKNNENNNNSDEHKNEIQDNTAKASHKAPIEKTPSIQPSYNLPCFQLRVIEQQHNDCGLHALANAESINECIKNNRYIYTGFSQQLSPAFYAQAAQILSTAQAQRDIYNDHLSPIDLITTTKQLFNMDNCCVISLHNPHFCYTTKQPLEHLKAGIPDCSGILDTNKHIQQMVDELKHKEAGAVHFICAIKNRSSRPGYLLPDHWILISLVKEHGCPKPYMLYLDSNNTPFQQERDAQKHIDYIRTTGSNRLLGSLIST